MGGVLRAKQYVNIEIYKGIRADPKLMKKWKNEMQLSGRQMAMVSEAWQATDMIHMFAACHLCDSAGLADAISGSSQLTPAPCF